MLGECRAVSWHVGRAAISTECGLGERGLGVQRGQHPCSSGLHSPSRGCGSRHWVWVWRSGGRPQASTIQCLVVLGARDGGDGRAGLQSRRFWAESFGTECLGFGRIPAVCDSKLARPKEDAVVACDKHATRPRKLY
jgi:hypothetical protein